MSDRKCRICDKLYALTEFAKANKGRTRRYECRQCRQQQHRDYYSSNRQALLKKRKLHYAANSALYQGYASARRQRVKRATLPLLRELTDFVFAEALHLCKLRKASLGIPHVVDHIIPLKGEHVSGLHVWNNFQVLTKLNNAVKGNRYVG